MRTRIISLLGLTVLLSACTKTTYVPDQEALLQNPLYAEQYSEELVDAMVNLEIYEDPIVKDAEKKKIIDNTKEKWLKVAKKARTDQREGSKGGLIPIDGYVDGEVLYRHDKLHFPAYFASTPGPSIHVYLSTVVDPRDVAFPDESALDLGEIYSPYGAQTYAVPTVEDPRDYRTVALWDTKLEKLYGFAQINPLY